MRISDTGFHIFEVSVVEIKYFYFKIVLNSSGVLQNNQTLYYDFYFSNHCNLENFQFRMHKKTKEPDSCGEKIFHVPSLFFQ